MTLCAACINNHHYVKWRSWPQAGRKRGWGSPHRDGSVHVCPFPYFSGALLSDPVADLKDVVRRSGTGLRAQMMVRKIEKLGRGMRRAGARPGQAEFCRVVSGGGDGLSYREWMYRMCVVRLMRGDYSDWTGWEYRNDWAVASYSPECETRRWRLEPVKSLAVLGEQGIGDEVMFGGVLGDLSGIDVTYECDPRLVEVFKREGVKAIPRKDITQRGDPVVRYLTMKREQDAFIPAGDLPRLFRKSLGAFPRKAFLRALPAKVEEWSHLRGRTGVAWRSRTGSFKPEQFKIKDPVCLQYDSWEYETEGMTVPKIDLRNDVEDLLGICANLEKVVSVPQTIVHFAGAIGTRVEVVIPPAGSGRVLDMFRWRYTDPMPWYKDVKVFESLAAWR